MPNQRRADKKQISVWITVELFYKFQKKADAIDMTMTEIITAFLLKQTESVILSARDYENIANEIKSKKCNN